jgi:hypothetical protein
MMMSEEVRMFPKNAMKVVPFMQGHEGRKHRCTVLKEFIDGIKDGQEPSIRWAHLNIAGM